MRPSKTKRWTRGGQEGEDLPRGPLDALEHALSILEPFRAKHGVAADRLRKQLLSGQSDGHKRAPLSRDEAVRLIRIFATSHNWHVRLEKDAPRLKTILQDLARIEAEADTLRRTLADLDDFTRSALQQSQDLLQHALNIRANELADLYELANGEGLPMPEPDPKMPGPYWTDQLASLSQYAGAIAGVLATTWGSGDPDRVDRGGSANTYRKLHGSPKWRLACSAWAVFEINHPGEAIGKEGGPLYQLVAAIYEYATAEPGDDTTGLDWCVKRAAAASSEALRRLRPTPKGRRDARSAAGRNQRVDRMSREADDLADAYRALGFDLFYGYLPREPDGTSPPRVGHG